MLVSSVQQSDAVIYLYISIYIYIYIFKAILKVMRIDEFPQGQYRTRTILLKKERERKNHRELRNFRGK